MRADEELFSLLIGTIASSSCLLSCVDIFYEIDDRSKVSEVVRIMTTSNSHKVDQNRRTFTSIMVLLWIVLFAIIIQYVTSFISTVSHHIENHHTLSLNSHIAENRDVSKFSHHSKSLQLIYSIHLS